MDRHWVTRLKRSAWLPPATLVAAVTLFFWHVLLRPTTAWVGDACSIDFQGTLQQLWLLRFHHYDLGELSRTVYMTYPIPVNLFSELGFILDVGLLAGMQAILGTVLGYNVGAWAILVGLGLAIYRCARQFDLTPWFAAIAALIAVSAEPVAIEVAFGRHYQILSLATATLCLAEWPRLTSGDRWASMRTGLWLAVTVFAHAFTGLLVGFFLLGVAVVAVWRAAAGQRKPLLAQLLWAGGATFLLAIGPVILQMNHLPSGEEGIGMLSGYEEYYRRVFQRPELRGLSPLRLVRSGLVRLLPLGLAAVALLVKSRRPAALFFTSLLVLSVVVVWGPYQRAFLPIPGSPQMEIVVPLPYIALRAVLPYFWRLLWLERVVLFASVAVGILSGVTLAWAYRALRSTPLRARGAVVIALVLCLAQPVAHGALPLARSHVVEETEEGAAAAALLERVRTSADVKVVFSIARALHLQERFERPVSAPKWTYYVSCDNRTLDNCGRFFDSFVEMPHSLAAKERIRLGLCHLENAGTTHLLFFPRKLIRRAGFRHDPVKEAAVEAEQNRVREVLQQLAPLVDEGGGIQLYKLRACTESPKAKASGLTP